MTLRDCIRLLAFLSQLPLTPERIDVEAVIFDRMREIETG